jgi:phage-related protein
MVRTSGRVPHTTLVFYREANSVLFRDWLESLPVAARAKCLYYVTLLEAFGHELRRPVADFLRDGIYELRPTSQNVHYRILYSFVGQQVAVVSHGLAKRDVVPEVEIEKAIARVARFRKDRSLGVTYEEN